MVHLAIDGMWQVFKLQQSTPRNDFCRIAAKNGILLRLINTLYSLNESTRLASMSVGGGFLVDGSTQRPRSGILDPTHPFVNQNEALLSSSDQQDLPKVRRGVLDHHLEPSHSSSSNPRRSDANYLMDVDRPQSSNAAAEAVSLEKSSNLASRESSAGTLKERENVDRWKNDISRADVEPRQQRISISANRTSTDRPPKLIEPSSNGLSVTGTTQQEQVRPLLSLLEKEPPSGRFSGQLEYVRQFSGLEKHESVLPLLHASEKKTNGELDFLMAEFAGNNDLSFFFGGANCNKDLSASMDGYILTQIINRNLHIIETIIKIHCKLFNLNFFIYTFVLFILKPLKFVKKNPSTLLGIFISHVNHIYKNRFLQVILTKK